MKEFEWEFGDNVVRFVGDHESILAQGELREVGERGESVFEVLIVQEGEEGERRKRFGRRDCVKIGDEV